MAGFNARGVQTALQELQTDYDQLINEGVVNYQESAIKRICDNWQSDLAVEQMSKLVSALNESLDTVTDNLKSFFPSVNSIAQGIAEAENALYTPTDFVPSETRFADLTKATNEEGNIDCKRDKVSRGFENLDKFLDNRLKKNMDDFDSRANDLAKAFDYDDKGDELRDQLKSLSNSVSSFADEIQKKGQEFHTKFEEWADKNEFKLEENIENIGEYKADTSGLSGFNW